MESRFLHVIWQDGSRQFWELSADGKATDFQEPCAVTVKLEGQWTEILLNPYQARYLWIDDLMDSI